MSPIDQQIAEIKERFGGMLVDEEIAALLRVWEVFEAVLDAGRGFDCALEAVQTKLRELCHTHHAPDAVHVAVHVQVYGIDRPMSAILEDIAKDPREITEEERQFLNDAIGAIDFVIRNGIGFGVIAGALGHDISEIRYHGGLKQALAAPFLPKVKGWAELNEDSIGGPADVDVDD